MMTTRILRSLHHGSTPLLLPNAWDAGSARMIESLGAQSIATTSAGLCRARGIESLPLNLMLVPGLPSVAALYKLGVRRLSAGPALAQAALGQMRELVASYLVGNLDEVFAHPAAEYGVMNKLFQGQN